MGLLVLTLIVHAAPFFGINCDLVWEPAEDWPKIVETLMEAKVQTLRMPLRWTVLETKRGEWDFSRVDDAIKIVPDSVEILATLMSVPSWANGTVPGECEGWFDCYPPKDLKDWENFVQTVVRRYKNRIHHWEIWNEQNGVDFYRPIPNPKEYTELLKTAYETIKKEDPSALVLLGGLQMNGVIPSPWSPVKVPNYLEDLYKNGAKPYFDICNIHPYVLPDEGAEYMMNMIKDTFKVMEKYGDAQKPVWITEVGAGINEKDTAEDQATLLFDTFRVTRKEPRIHRVYWFLLRDTEENILGPEETMGIVTRKFEKRPAFFAYLRSVNELQKPKNRVKTN